MKIHVSGKLMISGEYAVLRPFGQAVLRPTKRQLTMELTDRYPNKDEEDAIILKNEETLKLYKVREKGEYQVVDCENLLFIGFNLMFDFLKAFQVPMKDMVIRISSELETQEGISLGLGSSAALSVGIVKSCIGSIEDFHRESLFQQLQFSLSEANQNKLVYRLAMILHYLFQGNGSGADIAVCTYGETILYEGIDATWLKHKIRESKIEKNALGHGVYDINAFSFISQEWQGGNTFPITFPQNLYMIGIWTGKKVSSKGLVNKFWEAFKRDPDSVKRYCNNAQNAIDRLIKSCADNDAEAFIASIIDQKNAVRALDVAFDMGILTPIVQSFERRLENQGIIKISGAGGGDCLICYNQNPQVYSSVLETFPNHQDLCLIEFQ